MQISVIIPVWNGEHQIGMCLDALRAQTLAPAQFEVLVVDNGSTDATADVVRQFPFAQLVSEQTPGSYRARNAGLARARAPYVAFTDADCIPAVDWLEKALLAITRHGDFGILAGHIELFRNDPNDSETCEAYERLFALNQEMYARWGASVTANWISPTDLLRSLGGFDATLKSGGDFEMSRRITRAGHALIYCPDVTVRHPIRGRINDILAKTTRMTGGRWTRDRKKTSALKFGVNILVDGARKLRTIVRHGPASTWLKLKVSALLVLVVVVALYEYVRLMCSGEPRRA